MSIIKAFKIGTVPKGSYVIDGRCTLAVGRVVRARPNETGSKWGYYIIRDMGDGHYLRVDPYSAPNS